MKFLLSLLSIDSFKKFCREIIQRQTPTKGHSNKQDKSPHGGTLLFPFAPCRRMGQRAAVRNNLCFAAQLNTGFVSRLPCLSAGTGLVRRGGNAIEQTFY